LGSLLSKDHGANGDVALCAAYAFVDIILVLNKLNYMIRPIVGDFKGYKILLHYYGKYLPVPVLKKKKNIPGLCLKHFHKKLQPDKTGQSDRTLTAL
jgi:hypothetical protein